MKKLNWQLFVLALLICALGAVSRIQDNSLGDSFVIFCVVGIPLSAIFLFVKNK